MSLVSWTVSGLSGALLLCTSLDASPAIGTDEQPARIIQALEQYNALSDLHLPTPSPEQTRAIAAGEIVKLRERLNMASPGTKTGDQGIRVVGYRLIERPRLLVWLAALDVGTVHIDRLTEHVISSDHTGGAVWYQYLRLPWPLRDRHWIVSTLKSADMTAATDGMIWENAWRLSPGGRDIAARLLEDNEVAGLSGAHALRAVYLPANRGAWTMFEIDDRLTLVASHMTVELGGIIPDGLVASYASRQLEKILTNLEARSDIVGSQYDSSFTIYTGAGEAITPAMAVETTQTEKQAQAAGVRPARAAETGAGR